jgi:ABC-type antimicrobial peptide transport system permease subunit
VRNLELGRGLVLTAAGVLLGVGGSYALMRFLSGFLFGVDANDLPTFALVAALLALVATFASYVAARRATKVDPLVALRAE